MSKGRRVSESSKSPEMERWRDGWGRSGMVGVVVELEVKAPVYSVCPVPCCTGQPLGEDVSVQPWKSSIQQSRCFGRLSL